MKLLPRPSGFGLCGDFHVRVSLNGQQPVTRMRILKDTEVSGRFVAPIRVNFKLTFLPANGFATRKLELAHSFHLLPARNATWTAIKYKRPSSRTATVLVDTDGDQIPETYLPKTTGNFQGKQYAGRWLSGRHIGGIRRLWGRLPGVVTQAAAPGFRFSQPPCLLSRDPLHWIVLLGEDSFSMENTGPPEASMKASPHATNSAWRLFDRERASHPWKKAFEELCSPDPGMLWAVAANWRMDHRVSEEREAEDLGASSCFQGVENAKEWQKAVGDYFRQEICQPAYASAQGLRSACFRPTNELNRVSDGVTGFDELVHVGSLNAILRRLSREGVSPRFEVALRELTGRGLDSPDRDDLDRFDRRVSEIARAMLVEGPQTIREMAGLMCDSLGETEPPWWAGFVAEIRSTIEVGTAADLCTVLGLGHRVPGEWLLVWRYPVHEVSPIFRPTAVEANDSPYHFPSPPEYGLGITMPLAPTVAACREVVHRPLRGAAAVERCTGRLLRLARFPAIGDNVSLATLRAAHRERLRSEFGTIGLSAWMERHPEPLS